MWPEGMPEVGPLRRDPPDVFVIDLRRQPSQGQAAGHRLPAAQVPARGAAGLHRGGPGEDRPGEGRPSRRDLRHAGGASEGRSGERWATRRRRRWCPGPWPATRGRRCRRSSASSRGRWWPFSVPRRASRRPSARCPRGRPLRRDAAQGRQRGPSLREVPGRPGQTPRRPPRGPWTTPGRCGSSGRRRPPASPPTSAATRSATSASPPASSTTRSPPSTPPGPASASPDGRRSEALS